MLMATATIRNDYRRSEKLMAVWKIEAPFTLRFSIEEMGLQDKHVCSMQLWLLESMRERAFFIILFGTAF